MLRHLVLDELQTDSVPVELDDETVASLGLTGLVSVLPAHGGLWKILPCGPVGAVQVGDLLVEVKPKAKVGLGRLLFLLGYARDPGFRPEDVAGLEDSDLFSALAESLARQVLGALSRGVHSGYVTVDEALRTVRGRIRVGDQMSRRPGMLIPLEVTYDDFTVDIPENRILRSALRLMMGPDHAYCDLPAVGNQYRVKRFCHHRASHPEEAEGGIGQWLGGAHIKCHAQYPPGVQRVNDPVIPEPGG